MGPETAKKKGFIEGLRKEVEDAFSVKPPFAKASKAAEEEKTETLSGKVRDHLWKSCLLN